MLKFNLLLLFKLTGSRIIYFLFTPIRLIQSMIYSMRFTDAKKEAQDLFERTGKKAIVVQNGMHFKTGLREDLRKGNLKLTYFVKTKDSRLLWDYRNAIVYTVEYNKTVDYTIKNDGKPTSKHNKKSKL